MDKNWLFEPVFSLFSVGLCVMAYYITGWVIRLIRNRYYPQGYKYEKETKERT